MNNNNILAGLTKAAAFFVDKMKQRLSGGRFPSAISSAISIGTAKQEGNNSYIDISIDLKKAPMAAAFEFGSGEHAMRGKRGTYRIPSVPGKMLKIPAERLAYPPADGGDFLYISEVQHPGIEPRQYIAPTMVETKDEIGKMIGQSFKEAVLLGGEKVTVIEVKL